MWHCRRGSLRHPRVLHDLARAQIDEWRDFGMLLPVLDSGQVYWAMQQPDRLVTDQGTIVHRECGDSVVVIVTSSKRVDVHQPRHCQTEEIVQFSCPPGCLPGLLVCLPVFLRFLRHFTLYFRNPVDATLAPLSNLRYSKWPPANGCTIQLNIMVLLHHSMAEIWPHFKCRARLLSVGAVT